MKRQNYIKSKKEVKIIIEEEIIEKKDYAARENHDPKNGKVSKGFKILGLTATMISPCCLVLKLSFQENISPGKKGLFE